MRKEIVLIISILLISAGFLSGCQEENKSPIAEINADLLTGEVPLSVTFNASLSSDEDGTIENYYWDFGDEENDSGVEVTHIFTSVGDFIVELTVTDDDGETDTATVTISVLPKSVFTQEESINLLLSNIISPGSSDDQISAVMLSKSLEEGEVITTEGGDNYTVDNDSWFVFIDDQPNSYYAHPTRYVLINAATGEYIIINESWPPLLNNFSIWDTDNHSKGDLIKIYTIQDAEKSITDAVDSISPSGDYGDAPDTQYAYYGVQGRFPTLYNTTNSRFGLPGGHTLNVGEETLGLSVSAEIDANDINDPDLVPNLVDSDKDDRIFVILNGSKAKISFTVKVSQNAPDIVRYVNILIDFNQNGNWSKDTYGPEWPIINMPVDVSPGTSKTITTPEFSWSNQSILPSPVWIRIALTRQIINTTFFSNNWDGSGQYEYGEIEDHIVYLTEDIPDISDPEGEWPPWPNNPPTGKDPDPVPPGPGPNPGPSKGPCGTDVNYHCIIISGGDSSSHMAKGMNPAKQATDTMTDLATDQGYNIVASLGPGKSGSSSNSISNIENALQNLKSQVKCGDHVLIYIVGHGNKASDKDGPGINLKGSDGKTDELLTPNRLSTLLGNSIPACPDEDCDVAGKCCHVSIVIESCYAGNFKGIAGQGRTVMGSSDDEPAAATNGGAFTNGFSSASRNDDSDTDGEDGVSPGEAFSGASNSVNSSNSRTGRAQEPWKDSNECECKCPCSPNITVDKLVFDGFDWVEVMEGSIGQIAQFKCEIENTGKCRNVTNVTVVDQLPLCMSYIVDSADLTYLGETVNIEPSSDGLPSGQKLTWNLNEVTELFAPDQTITIEYSVEILLPEENINEVMVSAQCTYDPSKTVSDTSSVIIYVTSE